MKDIIKICREREVIEKWEALYKKLNELDKDYTLIENNSYTYILINKKSIDKKDYTFRIYEENFYPGKALKIQSNFRNLKANRLRKTFTSPKIAESLHKRILELHSKNEENLKKELKI